MSNKTDKSNQYPMNKRKTLLFSFGTGEVTPIQLYKDPGEVPYWISRIYNWNAIIDDYVGDEELQYFRNVQLHRYSTKSGLVKEIQKILYVFKTAKSVDLLYLIHTSPQSFIRACAYRLGGGGGKIYLKMDAESSPTGKLMRWEDILPLKIFYLLLKPLPDIYTIETKRAYEQMATSCYRDLRGEKLFQMPNGFDEESLSELGISRIPVSQKERIILTVGRIGTHQKNTELLLDVLASTNLNEWKVYIVGPIEPDFHKKIEVFFEHNPHLKESVIFTGMISQKEKYDLYNRARIFILTSRHEGFCFVMAEAAFMRDYILTTDIGGAEDVLAVADGEIISSADVAGFSSALERIISRSDNELNEMITTDKHGELTWRWILENNKGIQKLLQSCDNGQLMMKKCIIYLLSPALITLIVLFVVLVYIGYNKLRIYPKIISPTPWIKIENEQ